MKILNKVNVSRDNNGPRKFSLELTTSGVISIAIVALLGMCWAFILGILLGRGYRPENAVPPLANIMPTTEAKAPDETVGAPPKVLKPEELQFMEGLQDKDKDGAVVADSAPKGSTEPKKLPGGAALKSHDLADAKPGAAAAAPTKPRPTPEPAKTQAKVDPKKPFDKQSEKQAGGKFRATYQIASFPAKDQAEAMAKRLSAKGLPASVHEAKSNNRTMFRVHIQLRGTAAEITEGLKKSGEKGPILLDKKPL